MEQKKLNAAKVSVAGQIVNMLTNDILFKNGIEPFEGWCADGEVFEEAGYDAEMIDICNELVRKVAPLVDEISQILNPKPEC